MTEAKISLLEAIGKRKGRTRMSTISVINSPEIASKIKELIDKNNLIGICVYLQDKEVIKFLDYIKRTIIAGAL